MGADAIQHLVHSYSLYLFRLRSPFDEDLGMKVIVVTFNILVCLSEQQHDVKTLLELLRWEVAWQNVKTKFIETQHAHMLISFGVMRRHGRHLIKNMAEVVSDLASD